MKAYSDYNGSLLENVQVVVEGNLIRLFFDFVKEEVQTEDGKSHEQVVCENVNATGRTYEVIVSAIITDRYSADTREAIFANYEEAKDDASELTAEKRAEYLKEYADFQAWRKHAKGIATEVLTKL